MITVGFLTPSDGRTLGFTVQGHSGHGEEGADIVCAAVSSAVLLTVNTVTDVLHITPLSLRGRDGDVFFRVEEKDEPACRDLFSGLKLHLVNLEEQYPGDVKVCYIEI